MRLANLIGIDAEEIGFLAGLTAESLYEFRQQLIEIYFAENAALGRFAKLANKMPSAVIAKLTVDVIGPILSARIVGEVEPSAAINVLKRVPIEFAVDTAIQADPRRIKPLFSESPSDVSKAIADELIYRKEYVAIGQLIAFVENDVMEHALGTATDIDVLRSSFMIENKERLADGLAMMSDERLESITKTAASEDMWLEVLDMMSHLEFDEFRRVVTPAMRLDVATLSELIDFVHENEFWYVAIPAICLAEDPSNGLEALLAAKPRVQRAFFEAIESGDYGDEVDELLEKVEDPKFKKLVGKALAAK